MLDHLLMQYFNEVGISGVALILLAYLLLQLDKLSQDSVSYSLLNLLGASLILLSLFYSWNLSAAVIEIAWIAISIFGLIKALVLRFRRKANE